MDGRDKVFVLCSVLLNVGMVFYALYSTLV